MSPLVFSIVGWIAAFLATYAAVRVQALGVKLAALEQKLVDLGVDRQKLQDKVADLTLNQTADHADMTELLRYYQRGPT